MGTFSLLGRRKARINKKHGHFNNSRTSIRKLKENPTLKHMKYVYITIFMMCLEILVLFSFGRWCFFIIFMRSQWQCVSLSQRSMLPPPCFLMVMVFFFFHKLSLQLVFLIMDLIFVVNYFANLLMSPLTPILLAILFRFMTYSGA